MRLLFLIGLLLFSTTFAKAQSAIMIVNEDWERCDFIVENEEDEKLRTYLIHRAPGFMSGLNIQRKMMGLPVVDFDFSRMELYAPWRATIEACRKDKKQKVHNVMLKVYMRFLKEQTGG